MEIEIQEESNISKKTKKKKKKPLDLKFHIKKETNKRKSRENPKPQIKNMLEKQIPDEQINIDETS